MATEEQWKARLLEIASEASADGMQCIENTMLALVRIIALSRRRQLVFAAMMHDFLTFLDTE